MKSDLLNFSKEVLVEFILMELALKYDIIQKDILHEMKRISFDLECKKVDE